MDHAQKVYRHGSLMISRLTVDHSASPALELLHNNLDDLYNQKVDLTFKLRDQLGRMIIFYLSK